MVQQWGTCWGERQEVLGVMVLVDGILIILGHQVEALTATLIKTIDLMNGPVL